MNIPEFHRQVRRRFSEAAATYAELCSIQAQVAGTLAERLPLRKEQRILDVGAGTGMLGAEIFRRAGSVSVVAVDAAEKMVTAGNHRNGGLRWLQADALALPFKEDSFDMVISSSSYQWVGDLPKAFGEVRRVLADKGTFYAAMFGRGTLSELFESLQAAGLASGRCDAFNMRRIASEREARAALDSVDFQRSSLVSETREVSFRDLWSLLKWLQGIGANGLSPGCFLGREFLAHVDEHYRARFSTPEGIRVSFEILWIEAVK